MSNINHYLLLQERKKKLQVLASGFVAGAYFTYCTIMLGGLPMLSDEYGVVDHPPKRTCATVNLVHSVNIICVPRRNTIMNVRRGRCSLVYESTRRLVIAYSACDWLRMHTK